MNLSFKPGKKPLDILNYMLKYEYDDNLGIGFKELSLEDDRYISGVVLKKTPIFIDTFDTNEGEIVKREEFILSEIEFVIDLAHNLIEIYANNKEIKKLLIVFSNTVGEFIKLEPVLFNCFKLLKIFNEHSDSCEISKLHIKEFKSEENVIGAYDIKFLVSDLAWKYVDRYESNLIRAVFSVSIDDSSSIINIFQNGKFKVNSKPKKENSKYIDLIKMYISQLSK